MRLNDIQLWKVPVFIPVSDNLYKVVILTRSWGKQRKYRFNKMLNLPEEFPDGG